MKKITKKARKSQILDPNGQPYEVDDGPGGQPVPAGTYPVQGQAPAQPTAPQPAARSNMLPGTQGVLPGELALGGMEQNINENTKKVPDAPGQGQLNFDAAAEEAKPNVIPGLSPAGLPMGGMPTQLPRQTATPQAGGGGGPPSQQLRVLRKALEQLTTKPNDPNKMNALNALQNRAGELTDENERQPFINELKNLRQQWGTETNKNLEMNADMEALSKGPAVTPATGQPAPDATKPQAAQPAPDATKPQAAQPAPDATQAGAGGGGGQQPTKEQVKQEANKETASGKSADEWFQTALQSPRARHPDYYGWILGVYNEMKHNEMQEQDENRLAQAAGMKPEDFRNKFGRGLMPYRMPGGFGGMPPGMYGGYPGMGMYGRHQGMYGGYPGMGMYGGGGGMYPGMYGGYPGMGMYGGGMYPGMDDGMGYGYPAMDARTPWDEPKRPQREVGYGLGNAMRKGLHNLNPMNWLRGIGQGWGNAGTDYGDARDFYQNWDDWRFNRRDRRAAHSTKMQKTASHKIILTAFHGSAAHLILS
jgi:hypothetical protein